ncbi:42568_t:CDS:1 [Gigaspora margarita]|uniref:42568_t:CDS:1 n=1 Tax=Gigaspora margarita TaxID=4874 RepID=A0ABN7WXX8_GIGMA|nr:42568_t:CDS:1 [Gigaspora margarita]
MDASYIGLDAILAQKDENKKEFVVAYTSRTLNSPEKNYLATKIECLAAIWAMQYFCPYIYGKVLEFVMNHQALKWLLNNLQPTDRLACWIIIVAKYPYTIQYKKGITHNNMDALFQIPYRPL